MDKVKKGCSTVLIVCGVFFILLIIGVLGGGSDDSDNDTGSKSQATQSGDEKKDSKQKKQTKKKQNNQAKQKNTKVEDKEEKKANDNIFDCEYDDTTLEYDSVDITEDDLGNKVLVLYFNFTNNSKKNKAFLYTYTVRAFQNGVEMNDNFFHVGQETKNASAEVQPGTTVKVAKSYEYTGDQSAIQVEAEPWVSLSDKKLLHFTLTFK